MNRTPSLYREFSVVDRYFIRVERDLSDSLFCRLTDMVQTMNGMNNFKGWRFLVNAHRSVLDWLRIAISDYIESSRIELVLLRINKPVETLAVHSVISEISFPMHGNTRERFLPVSAREMVSFVVSELSKVLSRGPIVVVTPTILRGREGYFLPVIGGLENIDCNINYPTRSLMIASGRMIIPPGTTYLVRAVNR